MKIRRWVQQTWKEKCSCQHSSFWNENWNIYTD